LIISSRKASKKGSRKASEKKTRKAPRLISLGVLLALSASACSTLPEADHKKFTFPAKSAFVGDVKNRPYKAIGQVRTEVNYTTLDQDTEEEVQCRNYYNKAVIDLVKRAKKVGADAVIDIKSVVFLEDGRREEYKTAECSDDGQEGQILLIGIAVKWKSAEEVDAAAPAGVSHE